MKSLIRMLKPSLLRLALTGTILNAFSGSGIVLAEEAQLTRPPASLPRVTNTIVRVNHRPIATSSNAPAATAITPRVLTRGSATLPTQTEWPSPMPSQLVAIASQPSVTGEKTVVKLMMKNGLAEKIESARAAVFLQDDQGKVIGPPTTRWVIGGNDQTPGLAPGATNSFHFVITGDKSLVGTNFTAQINFSRIVLEGGKVGDATKDVVVQRAK